MVLLAVVKGEYKEVLEGADIVSNEHAVVSLANGCYFKVMEKRDAKTRVLSSVKLLVVVNSIQVS